MGQRIEMNDICREGKRFFVTGPLWNAACILYLCLQTLACNNKDVVQLTVNDHNPTGSPPAVALDDWAKQVTEACDGKLELNVIHDAALLAGEDVYSGVEGGIADIAFYVLDTNDGFELNSVMSLPFMGWPDPFEADEIYQNLLDEFSEIKDEWSGVTIIGMHMMLSTHMHFADTDVTTIEDIQGLRIMASQQMTADTVNTAGAIPVSLDINKMGEAFEKGLIDGVFTHFTALEAFDSLDKVNYHLMFGENGINMTPMFIIMNSDVLEHLDSDVQKVLLESGTKWRKRISELDEEASLAAIQKIEDKGDVITELTEEEIDEWKEVIAPTVHETWIAKSVAKGWPAQDIYYRSIELISK